MSLRFRGIWLKGKGLPVGKGLAISRKRAFFLRFSLDRLPSTGPYLERIVQRIFLRLGIPVLSRPNSGTKNITYPAVKPYVPACDGHFRNQRFNIVYKKSLYTAITGKASFPPSDGGLLLTKTVPIPPKLTLLFQGITTIKFFLGISKLSAGIQKLARIILIGRKIERTMRRTDTQ